MSMSDPLVVTKNDYPFLKEGGEMGELIRAFDWTSTPLGSPQGWPAALKIQVAIMLRSPFPMHITWSDQFIQLYNDGYRPLLGNFKHPKALGSPIWASFPEIWDTIGPMFSDVMDGKAFRFPDFKLYLDRNGYMEECYFDFAYSPIVDENGVIGGVLTNEIETTQRKMVEFDKERLTAELSNKNVQLAISNQELTSSNKELSDAQNVLRQTFLQLEESEIALRLAIEAANFGTWHINSVTRKFVTSARLNELFGFPPEQEITIEEAIGQITESYREYVSTALENAIYNNGDYDVTYPVIGFLDGKLRWLRAIGNLKVNPSGMFGDFTGVVMDVSEMKKDEQRKNDFIGMVSHELKTPLTSVNGFIQILLAKAQKGNDAFASGALEQSVKQLKKMTAMINGFLNVSRFESGKIAIEKISFDIVDLIEDIKEETRQMITSHEVIFDPIVPTLIYADRDKIGQVFSNLISNAAKYAPSGTIIQISCLTINNTLQVSVRDQGIGISDQDLNHLFDRYYRVENSIGVSGFGIGLYLCAEIIAYHNGKIWVESKLGNGSTFFFSLPRRGE
jgi:two-component system sensor histidine kinase VicK